MKPTSSNQDEQTNIIESRKQVSGNQDEKKHTKV